ncbi:MAG: hypothetical protein R2748_31015 [Bryobacterales bacterium]
METLEKAMQDEALPGGACGGVEGDLEIAAVQLYKLTALEDRLAALELVVEGAPSRQGWRFELKKRAAAAERAA